MESVESLDACVKSTRKHLKMLEAAQTAQRTKDGLTDQEILKVVTQALQYHRKQYDVWMQMKLDNFADKSWDEFHLQDQEPSRTPSAHEDTPVRSTSLEQHGFSWHEWVF
jgi:hypothetical protein